MISDGLYVMEERWTIGAVRAEPVTPIRDPEMLAFGSNLPNDPIHFAVAEGRRFLDLVGTTHVELVLLSGRAIESLRKGNAVGWGTFGVILDGAPKPYCGLAVLGRSGPPLWGSEKHRPGIRPDLPGIQIRLGFAVEKDQWDRSDLFRPEGTAFVVATSKVKELCEQQELTNFIFCPLGEVESVVLPT